MIVSGTVRDQVDVERVLNRARGLSAAYLSADGRVIDRLTTEANSQISIKTYILEVDKTGQSTWACSSTAAPRRRATTRRTPSPSAPRVFTFTEVPGHLTVPWAASSRSGGFARTTMISGTISLLISSGHARELASPNLDDHPRQGSHVPRGRPGSDPRIHRERRHLDRVQELRRDAWT